MIGLIAIVVVIVLLVVAGSVFGYAFFWAQKKGKSTATSLLLAVCAVFMVSLPITWDAIPTWIAFKYYSDKEAGLKVYKTLEQWKLENPGVAETLTPYAERDKRAISIALNGKKSRQLLNDRFAVDSQYFDRLAFNVYAHRFAVTDVKKEQLVVTYTEIGSGNSGGLASGGAGWWAFWLINKPNQRGVNSWSDYLQNAKNIGVKL